MASDAIKHNSQQPDGYILHTDFDFKLFATIAKGKILQLGRTESTRWNPQILSDFLVG
jgi:hypothetical protein